LDSPEFKRQEGTAAVKEQAIQYLAMDVHQATIVACVRDERGAITMRATVPTDARAILSLVRGAGSRVHVVFEEGTQAQWLHDLLQPHVERVVVCNVRGKRGLQQERSPRRRTAF
jgi:hypothetical protein